MTTPAVCLIEPFRYQATPQSVGEEGASSNQINEQHLEDYLSRLRTAICEDIEAIVSSEGATTFLGLTDTPATYAGAAGQAVAVNGAETGLEFVSFPTDDTGLYLDFDTDEQQTPRLWLAGEAIFQKTVVLAGNIATGTTNIAHGISGLSTVLFMHGMTTRSNGAQIPIPFASPTLLTFSASHSIDATNVILNIGTSWAGAGNVLSNYRGTIFYLKT